MAAAKFDQHLFRRLVLDGTQVLQRVLPAGVQFLGRQVRPPQNIGKNGQSRR